MNTNKEYVDATIKVLHDNPEWENIYERYATELENNKEKYKKNSSCFRVKSPLVVYSSIGKVKTEVGTSRFDLRYAGQSVGEICVNTNNPKGNPHVKLNVSKAQSDYARDKFDFNESIEIKGKDWESSQEAKAFRHFYSQLESTNLTKIKSPEHRIESYLLQEFSKKTRADNKKLCNIQPVRLGGKFFQLTTPLKASTHVPTISLDSSKKGAKEGAAGGGIDILARVKHANNEHRFAIIELKDENKESESQKVAMFQAITYATFVAHLLRSKSGRKWWNFFRDQENKKPVDNHIHLDVVTLMPLDGKSEEGEMAEIEVPGLNVTLHPYTLYYQVDKDGNPSSFQGTLTEVLQK